MKSVHRRFVLILGVSAALVPCRVFADQENWAVNSAWVKELTQREQAAVLYMLRGTINQHINERVLPSAMKSPQDWVWMLKLQATASFMQSELSTKNPDMRKFFLEYADRLKYTINTGDTKNYLADGEWANTVMRGYLSELGRGQLEAVTRQYAKRLKDTGTALIAFSIQRNSGR